MLWIYGIAQFFFYYVGPDTSLTPLIYPLFPSLIVSLTELFYKFVGHALTHSES